MPETKPKKRQYSDEAMARLRDRMAKARAARKGKKVETLEDSPYALLIDETVAEAPKVEDRDNGHKQEEAIAVVAEAPPAPQYKYRALTIAKTPEKFSVMTPKWLFRRIHWEEQAKIARVKPSGIGEKLKMGAAVVVLCLFGVVIFLFGVIVMGGSK